MRDQDRYFFNVLIVKIDGTDFTFNFELFSKKPKKKWGPKSTIFQDKNSNV